MATPENCLGHQSRAERRNKIQRLHESPVETPDENLKMLIKKGPTSEETSLKGLEEYFADKSGWKVLEDGGVLSIPVVEFRMMDQPKPADFNESKETKIEHYPVGQTIEDLNALVLAKFKEEKENFLAAGMSEEESERFANVATLKFPLFSALAGRRG